MSSTSILRLRDAEGTRAGATHRGREAPRGPGMQASRSVGHAAHQYTADAYTVQAFGVGDKPIRLVQALVGLYLHIEHGSDGRQVQRVHMILADQRPDWPALPLPEDRGKLKSWWTSGS